MPTMTQETYEVIQKIAAIHTLRINVKSLTAEAKFNRQEMRRCGPKFRNRLASHRRGPLREEARSAHLALAYIRGRRYKEVEQKTHEPLGFYLIKKLKQKVCKHLCGAEKGVNDWLVE